MAPERMQKPVALALLVSLLVAVAGGGAPVARAELRPLYRSARVQAMGGAGVALADDESALYINPAAMAGNQEATLHYAVVDADAAANIYSDYPVIMQAMSNFTTSSVNSLMGRNTYARLQGAPTLTMPGFGFGIIGDTQFGLYARNQALPHVTLGYQQTMGAQVAYGFSVNKGRGRRRKSDLRFGIAAKALFRRGGFRQLSVAELYTLTNQGAAGLSNFAGNYGLGLGIDLGAQYIRKLGRRWTLQLGVSFTDAGDTAFSGGADSVQGSLTAGAAAIYEKGTMKLSIAFDHSNILEDVDWRLKNHIGAELRFPVVRIYGGINQVYLTYGVGFDLWLVDVTAMSYAQELGSFAFQDSNRRYMVRAGLKFNL